MTNKSIEMSVVRLEAVSHFYYYGHECAFDVKRCLVSCDISVSAWGVVAILKWRGDC